MINYQKKLDELINSLDYTPTLLLHSCCAPCSSYVIEYLSQYFYITVFYYNPNIDTLMEYRRRSQEQEHFIQTFPTKYPVSFIQGDFEQEKFFSCVKGLEQEKEGGVRCQNCFWLRLRKTASIASQMHFDYFTTTLSISPLKNAVLLNEIGQSLAEEYQIPYLVSDFKKKNGFLRSTQISKEYQMYRQDYCGCIFSKQQRLEEKSRKERG